jgi:hypothetical protein
LRNRPITYFWGQTTYVARFEAKFSRKQTSLAFLPKTPPKSFFQMARFEEVFFYETAPSPIFRTKWTMWRILRQNCCRRKVQSFLPKMPLQSFFLKTHFRFEFFFYIAPSPIFRAKNDCGAFRGKSVTAENFAHFCLKLPEIVFLNGMFRGCIFLRIRPLTHFLGQTDYLAPFEAKLFRM